MSKARLDAYVTLVEARLQTLLPVKNGQNDVLIDAMNYSLLSGGKRLRPCLTLASCAAVGGEISTALDSACAVECIHAYSLIHDDLPGMDDDTLRRGKPTNHMVFGVGMAILAGDGLQNEAFRIISRDWLQRGQPQLGLELLHILAEASGCDGMVVGQAVDLLSEGIAIDENTMRYIHINKTGAMIRAACLMGAKIGGADDKSLQAIREYANCVGIAFQIVDDILDITGSEEVLGKPVGSDEKNAKATYPSLFGLEKSRQMAEVLCAKAQHQLDQLSGDVSVLRYLADYILKRQK